MTIEKDIEALMSLNNLDETLINKILEDQSSLSILNDLLDKIVKGDYPDQYTPGPVLAILILTQLNDKDLVDKILALCDIDQDDLEHVFGEHYSSIFSACLGTLIDDVSVLDGIIFSDEVSELAVTTAVQSYLTLVRRQVINRDQCFVKFKAIFESEDMSVLEMTLALACVLNIHPRAIESSIKIAYKNQLISEDMIPLDAVNKVLKQKKDKYLNQFKQDMRFAPIENAVKYFKAIVIN